MSIVADEYRFVVGVDTHAATHQFVIVNAFGRVIDQAEFPTSKAGLARACAWIGRRTEGDLDGTLISVEGTGSYGSQLARLLIGEGYRVVDAPTPKRERGQGKNDAIDALIAARGALPRRVNSLAEARAGELQATLKTLVSARDQMTSERTRAINALTARLRATDLGVDARRKPNRATIRQIAAWRRREEPLSIATARNEATRLARRVVDLDAEIASNKDQLDQVIADHAPALLGLPGVGAVNAAIVLVAWSHPGRIRSDAAFAKLAGSCPIEVSSGNSHHHRLDRGGDRRLNRALHSIAMTRMRCDETTRAYVERRTHEGQSYRRIRRCLKRYIARELYRTLNNSLDRT